LRFKRSPRPPSRKIGGLLLREGEGREGKGIGWEGRGGRKGEGKGGDRKGGQGKRKGGERESRGEERGKGREMDPLTQIAGSAPGFTAQQRETRPATSRFFSSRLSSLN